MQRKLIQVQMPEMALKIREILVSLLERLRAECLRSRWASAVSRLFAKSALRMGRLKFC